MNQPPSTGKPSAPTILCNRKCSYAWDAAGSDNWHSNYGFSIDSNYLQCIGCRWIIIVVEINVSQRVSLQKTHVQKNVSLSVPEAWREQEQSFQTTAPFVHHKFTASAHNIFVPAIGDQPPRGQFLRCAVRCLVKIGLLWRAMSRLRIIVGSTITFIMMI